MCLLQMTAPSTLKRICRNDNVDHGPSQYKRWGHPFLVARFGDRSGDRNQGDGLGLIASHGP